ncbi:hypothetical protein RB195_024684 [Necator americanus]|uniref:C2H2-type domain-containing protein n=1 Tax=Necator americanus TaxID=51031 RepID=A0ABR1EPA7_NECAM
MSPIFQPGIRDLQVYLDSCSEDVRSLFERECSIMLECRTCKSIFRSFINFFSHKRGFCRSETCENKNGHFPPSSPKRIVGLRRTNLSKHVFKKLGVAEISGINEVRKGTGETLHNNNTPVSLEFTEENTWITSSFVSTLEGRKYPASKKISSEIDVDLSEYISSS